MGRLYVAILGLLVVGVILVIQMAQGEANALHWVAVRDCCWSGSSDRGSDESAPGVTVKN